MNEPESLSTRRHFLAGLAGAALSASTFPSAAAPSYIQLHGSTTLSVTDLQNLLVGLGFAATGGGGGYQIGQALVAAIIRDIPPSQWVLYDLSSASDSDYAVMAGGIGAPSAITPSTILDFAGYADLAIQAYTNNEHVKVNALVPVEAGPVNALLALYLGWKNGYKVFDCDGAGRAVPSLTNLVYAYDGYPIAPVWLAGKINGETTPVLLSPAPADAGAAEEAIRVLLQDKMNEAAALVCWGQTGAQLRNSAYVLPGTLSNLISLGRDLVATGFTKAGLLSYLQGRSDVVATYSGILNAIKPNTGGGYDDGYLYISADDGFPYRIHYLNENMIVYRDGAITTAVGTAPSAIPMLFQPGGSGAFQLLNNGDDLLSRDVVNHPIVFCVVKESCVLFKPDIAASFTTVLKNAPFNYIGPFVPAQSCTT
jgi:DUF917 family protein